MSDTPHNNPNEKRIGSYDSNAQGSNVVSGENFKGNQIIGTQKNYFGHNQVPPPPSTETIVDLPSLVIPEDNFKRTSCKAHFEHHKYGGELVSVNLDFLETNTSDQKIEIILDISFGQVDEIFPYRDGLAQKNGYIRFGIKHGKLRIDLQNGEMPLDQRGFKEDRQQKWRVTPTGTRESPVWEFEVNSQSSILEGLRCDEKLGVVNLLDFFCVLEATFEAQINSNDLEIMAQDGAWKTNSNPQVIETKRRAFFKKVVEPKLQEFISKVVLRYDSTINS